MIDTERKEDLFLDTKLIKSENKLGKLRIIDELHPVLGGQPTHEADQPNDNNPFLDLACTMQFTIDKVNAVDKKADTKLAKAQNLKDVANVSIARDNLGLGTSATMNATSTLSDRTDQTATIKAVNDVNRAASTAQKTANTANDKANSAQNRADSAYNLANSANNNANTRLEKSKNLSDLVNVATARNNLGLGTSATMNATSTLSDRTDQTATPKMVNDINRDVVTAQKTANNAHALAQSKQDKLEFVGKGKVMREGAYGIGRNNIEPKLDEFNDLLHASSGFYFAGASTELGKYTGDGTTVINLPQNDNYGSALAVTNSGKAFVFSKQEGTISKRKQIAFTSDISKNEASKAVNGWWKCGETGLLIQWGRARIASGNDYDSQKVSFPVSFSAPPFSITASDVDGGKVAGSVNATSSNFEVVAGSKPPITIGYIAIGY